MNIFTKLKYKLIDAYYEYRLDKANIEVLKHFNDEDQTELRYWRREYTKYCRLRLELACKKMRESLG